MVRTLLIDNYDSFTFNLFQLIAEVNGVEPVVLKNDELFWDDIDHQSYDNIVISPGPGSPEKPGDFGICPYAVVRATCPVLGVCLGHQGIAHYHGGKVAHAPLPMHGRRSFVHHDGKGIFRNIPNPVEGVRYHSLVVSQLPRDFVRTAWTENGITMGIRHATRPLYGVQFHPESICTQAGSQMLANFADITRDFYQCGGKALPSPERSPRSRVVIPEKPAAFKTQLQVFARELDYFPDPETAFVTLYGKSRDAFWLDSSRHEPGLARYSYMGDASGPRGHVLRWWTDKNKLSITRRGKETLLADSLLDHLDRELKNTSISVRNDLPFEFTGGYVGYFGYELLSTGNPIVPHDEVPDAIFIHADEFIVFDHLDKRAWIVHVGGPESGAQARVFFEKMEAQLRALPKAPRKPMVFPQNLELSLRHRPASYFAMIERCQQLLKDGESYEMCLTNQLMVSAKVDPLSYYRNLRCLNPAPYAAYLNFADVAVASSSPELFLSVDQNRRCEAKPIKGTARRHPDPVEDAQIRDALAGDEKTQAENLMIVDLLRNDLGCVCEVGSVHVPKLMPIETYATVHHMVSTIAGTLRSDCTVIDAIKASFPGGSMTGAPKVRTMDLLAGLEQGKRGVYSGAIGFLGFSGVARLNIVIRTAVIRPGKITIGTGGAIVALSDPQEELEETFVKLEPPLQALAATIGTTFDQIIETHWQGRRMFTSHPPMPARFAARRTA